MARKAGVFQVSQSKLSTYRRCRYAYFLKYVEKLRRKFKSRPLRFGSLVHEMIETDANNSDPFRYLAKARLEQGRLFAVEREEFLETVRDVGFIMTDYFDYWEQDGPKDQRFTYLRRKGKGAEHDFNVPLADGLELVGKLDGLATGASRSKLLVEHKSFRAMPNDDHRWRNLQSNIYKWALDKLDIHIDRLCWDYIRSKPPSVPGILKGGKVSLKRIDSLPSALAAFSKEHKVKLDPRVIQTAKSNRRNYFIRVFSKPNQRVVKGIVDDFIETALEMRDNHGKKKAKTIDRNCEWCDFEGICRAELMGLDRDFVISKEFIRRDQEDVEIQQV